MPQQYNGGRPKLELCHATCSSEVEGCKLEPRSSATTPKSLSGDFIWDYANRPRADRSKGAMPLTCRSPTPSAPTRWSVSRFGRTRSARPARCPCRNVFRAFVLLCRRLDLYGRELLAVDGTRIKAVNNKDRNFTRTWLQEFVRAADERLDDYLRRLRRGRYRGRRNWRRRACEKPC